MSSQTEFKPLSNEARHELNRISEKILNGTPHADIEPIDQIGCGVGRCVATTNHTPDGTIVKFALPTEELSLTDGIVQNAVEKHISNAASILNGYTLPLLDSQKGENPEWLCYPRATTECGITDIYRAWDELEEHGFNSSDFFADTNWGSWNDQPYLVDFGYAHPDNDCRSTTIASAVDIWKEISKKTATNTKTMESTD